MEHPHRDPVVLLNIGQSQSSQDCDFAQLDLEIVEASPLDAYTVAELHSQFRPIDGEVPISSCTAAGERILVSRSSLIPELNKTIAWAESQRLQRVVVTCTGEFDLFSATSKILLPGNILRDKVLESTSMWTAGNKVAVLVPVDEQQSFLTDRWIGRFSTSVHVSVSAFTISPQASVEDFMAMGNSLLGQGYRAAIMDCMGYSLAQGNAVEQAGLDVYLAKGVTIDAILAGE